MEFLSPSQVQQFLDNIQGQAFVVDFAKADGSMRSMSVMLDVKGKRSENVPVMDLSSGLWKSFNINRVFHLEAL